MSAFNRKGTCRSRLSVAVLSFFLAGCGFGSQSANQALSQALASTGTAKDACAKFAGTVTIDGKAPGDLGVSRVMVVLWNTKTPPKGTPPFAPCDPDGYFEFHTYDKADGIPVGNYVICFVQLQGGMRIGGPSGWRGPDQLKDLYSDPDKNKEDKDLVLDIKSPGKTSWQFDLKIDGKEPVTNAGPNAIKELK